MAKRKREKLGPGPILLWVFVIILIAILFFLINSSLFNVTKIVVKGNVNESAEEIISLSGISKETNILHVDEVAAKENIEKNNFFVVVEDINRTFPTGVEIIVTERTAMAQIGTVQNYYVIDEKGVMVEANPMPADGIITVTNMGIYEPQGGQQIQSDSPEKLEGLLQVLEAIKKYKLEGEIVGIDMQDPQKILLTYKGNIQVQIASGLTAETKLKDIKATVEYAKAAIKDGQVIHMENGKPYYIGEK